MGGASSAPALDWLSRAARAETTQHRGELGEIPNLSQHNTVIFKILFRVRQTETHKQYGRDASLHFYIHSHDSQGSPQTSSGHACFLVSLHSVCARETLFALHRIALII